MKKVIILLFGLFVLTTSYANDSIVVNDQFVTDSNFEKLFDKYSTKAYAATMAMAESLKQPVEHIYKILVKQQIVKAVNALLVLLLMIVFLILGIKFGSNVTDWDLMEVKEGTNTASPGISIFSAVFLLFITIFFFLEGLHRDILIGFINPEYGVIMDIVSLFKWKELVQVL